MNNNELYHYGILGMRWGVRRYQDQNGSLTKAGKKRYSQDDDAHEDYKKAHSSKSVKSMSNKELKEVNNRLQMESTYSNLTKKKTSAGKKFVTGVLVTAATGVASAYASKYMQKGAAYLGEKAGSAAKKAATAAVLTRKINKFKP